MPGDLFDRLDYLTGKELMFFALVDPPPDWLERAWHRPYYETFDHWIKNSLYQPSHQVISPQADLAAFAFAQQLGIDLEQPALIVTGRLDSKSFFFIPTDEIRLEKQLADLGYLASRMAPGQVLDAQFINRFSQQGRWQAG